MTRRLTLCAALLLDAVAAAEPEHDDAVLEPFRANVADLTEATVGTVSAPVGFDWRHRHLMVAGAMGLPIELNSFASLRGGVLVRRPAGGVLLEAAVSGVGVWETPASVTLARASLNQVGRPSRLELDLGVAVPLAEGAAITRAMGLPAVHLALNLYGTLRYRWYPGAQAGMKAAEIGAALFSPALTDSEFDALRSDRPSGMRVDRGRYGLLLGFGTDVYMDHGLFLSPRLLIDVPVLAPLTKTELYGGVELSLHMGVAL